MQQLRLLPMRYQSYGLSGLLVVTFVGLYGIELMRSTHGLIFIHDLLNACMGAMLFGFGSLPLLRKPPVRNKLLTTIHIAEVITGTLFFLNVSDNSLLLSDILSTALICTSAYSLLYMPCSKLQKIGALSMIGMSFIMIGFYAQLHTDVVSLTHFRMMR